MITFAPSPSWSVLIKLLFCKNPDDKALSSPWCKAGDKALWFSRTAWALHTISRWWGLNFSKKPNIWVPGYFCNQSLWPLRQTEANIVFYPIQEQMLPNWEQCNELAKKNKPDIFIVTHFYGLITPTQEIENFCNQNNTLLVEDAAHVLVPTDDVGKRGHFILYSPYKLFPLAHGAICIERPAMLEFLKKNNIEQKINLEMVSKSVSVQHPPVSKWFIKKIIQKIIGDRFDFLRKKVPFEEDGTSDPMPYTPQMHFSMKKLLSLFIKDISKISDHRKKCAGFWENIFKEKNIAVERLTFSGQETPYVAVFKSIYNEAPSIYNTYKKWPLSSWPDLPPEVKSNPDLHKTTLEFRNNMLVVPVHQTMKFSELKKRCH